MQLLLLVKGCNSECHPPVNDHVESIINQGIKFLSMCCMHLCH